MDMLFKLSVEELVEINDFYNSAAKIIITYVTSNTVLLELLEDGEIEEFILSKRDLIMVLKNFYVKDVCDIVLAGLSGYIEVKINKFIEDYPVEIFLVDGQKYFCNEEEWDYINKIINNQKTKNKDMKNF